MFVVSQISRCPIAHLTALMLVAVAWSNLAFCGEINEAAKSGDFEKVKALLRDRPDLVFSKDDHAMTPLHWAAAKGHKNLVEVLIANKAQINAEDNSGGTPLMDAALGGHRDTARLLIVNKAKVNAKDNDGRTPLRWAIVMGHEDIAELLRRHGGTEQ